MRDMNNELAAALAHEIKNPISLIRANVDYLRLNLKSDFAKCFEIIDKELNKLNSLISDYTTILQPDISYELIFPEDLIYDVTEEFAILDKKKIDFVFDIDRDIKIKGDYKKLSILLFNIYKNSSEAISGNGQIITRLYENGDNIIIEIEDNGGGINEGIIKNIGTPFFTTKEGGSGLGIMICKSIMEAHKGKILIENTACGCKTTLIFNK